MMHSVISIADRIHSHAIQVSSRYKRAQAELIDILQQVEDNRVYLKRGHSSLFSYLNVELRIGENIAYSLITVARKAREVPELKARIYSGEITLSNARRVASVLTPQNQADWLEKATRLSNRQLEKEIVKINPKEATREHASYVAEDRIRLEIGVSEWGMLKLRRVQDLLSRKRRRAVSLEETLGVLAADFLRRNDPVEKAKRHQVRNGSQVSVSASQESTTGVDAELVTRQGKTADKRSTREPIPAPVIHAVHLRDQGRCTHIQPDGTRCNQTRWIEIHHKTPVSEGGANTPDNLVTLCSTHHKFEHLTPDSSAEADPRSS